MKGSYHVNWNSIVNSKGAVDRTEIEGLLLAPKGFNANWVYFLPLYHVIIRMYTPIFMGKIFHVHGCALKTVLHVDNLSCAKNYKLWKLEICWWWCGTRFEESWFGRFGGKKSTLNPCCKSEAQFTLLWRVKSAQSSVSQMI